MSKVKQFMLLLLAPFFLWGGCLDEELFFSCAIGNAFFNEVCIHGTVTGGLDDNGLKCGCHCDEGWTGSKCDTPDDGGGHGNPNNRAGNIFFSQIQFENHSNTSVSYDVILDDTWIASVSPGGKSELLEVDPGIHHVIFRITGTSASACLNDEVILEPGKKLILRCNT